MDSQTAWSKTSLVNIKSDNYDNLSSASISGSNIVINNEGYAEYTYNYDPPPEDPEDGQEPEEDTSIKTNKLQFDLRVNTNNNQDVTRYNEKLIVEVTIQYYIETYNSSGEHTGWKEGNIDIINIYPYLQIETDGYTRTYIIDISDTPIKALNIKYKSKFNSVITFYNPKIFYSMTVVKAVEEYGGGGGGGGGGTVEPLPPPYLPTVEDRYDATYISSQELTYENNFVFETGRILPMNIGEQLTDIYYIGSSNPSLGSVQAYIKEDNTLALNWSINRVTNKYYLYYNSPTNLQIRAVYDGQNYEFPDLWIQIKEPFKLPATYRVAGETRPNVKSVLDLDILYQSLFDTVTVNGNDMELRSHSSRIRIYGLNGNWVQGNNSVLVYDHTGNLVLNLIVVVNLT